MYGPQAGIGKPSVAARWLGTEMRTDFGVRAKAAVPATTTKRAKKRITDFIGSNTFQVFRVFLQ
jgi:hypothetical protein